MLALRINASCRRMALALALISFAGPVFAQEFQKASAPASPASPAMSLPFDWSPGSLIVVDASVNGLPVRALLDTGAPNDALDIPLARKLGVPVVNSGPVYSIGGWQSIQKASNVRLSVGGLSGVPESADVYDMNPIRNELGLMFNAVIGAPTLSRSSVTVDFDRHVVQFGTPAITAPGASVVALAFDSTTRRMTTRVAVDGVAIEHMLLDTGAETELDITRPIFDALPQKTERVTDSGVFGLGGLLVKRIFAARSVTLGNTRAHDVVVEVEVDNGFLSKVRLDGSLGLSLLSRYNFTLDSPTGRLILMPRSHPDPLPPRSTVGVQVEYNAGRIRILHVMQHSPAELAGLNINDSICTIDGNTLPQSWERSPLRHWGTVPPGHNYVLGLCDGRTVHLTTASFY